MIVENTWTPRLNNPTEPKHKDDQQKQNKTKNNKQILNTHGTKKRKKSLKFAREKYQVTFKGKPIKLTARFFAEICKGWTDVF